jgi:(p)ppGpp synthase/HD superfamily hydrolase
MIKYTERLDSALRKAAWAHEKTGQHRKGTDIPYIIHPVGVMIIAGNVTENYGIAFQPKIVMINYGGMSRY